MRRITLWLLSTVAVLVLLFSYRTSTMGGGTAAGAGATSGRNPETPGGSTGTAAGGSGAPSGTTTYKGSVAQTRWGPVQVTITVTGGKITDVAVPVYPNGNPRDEEINAYALPVLHQEALASQSADIDTVSGATVTSDGYKQSLQAALDAAHLS
ncbi:FMN-binding protein [Actinomadura scrupuli]|uniref:FMN-binding protein n=1 Tax=Actinomadura scrupuli TaxID=559629 RepID=UPI003D9604FE